jgi:hypothetical protein
MIQHYLKVAFRNTWKYKSQTDQVNEVCGCVLRACMRNVNKLINRLINM